MTRRLWEISAELGAAREALLDMGVDQQTVDDTLAAISMEWREKAVNVAAFIRHLEADAAADKARYSAFQSDLDRIKQAADAKLARAKHLRKYLAEQMERNNVSKIEHDNGPPIVLSQRSEIVLIDEAVPDEYMRVSRSVDKVAAKKAAREIGDCNWAVEVKKPTLRIG